MPEFIERTTRPTSSDAYYYADNPYYQSGYGMPNCTCYAFGRFWELCGGSTPKLSLRNAENWYGHSDGYKRGKTPKLGAVICWRKGAAGVSSDGAGHVAIVEKINADGSIETSESGWQSSAFWWRKTRQNDGNWGQSSAYVFQGFIYNPIDFEESGLPDDTPISGNRYLTMSEMQINARYIWNYLGSRGWSLEAVCGMLGNMQVESTINPAIWESLTQNENKGYGLVQWTPATKFLNWCSQNNLDPSVMDSALKRLEYELENGLQYYATNDYPLTFKQFKTSTKDPNYLAMAFLYNYERARELQQPVRGKYAQQWYEYLAELTPQDPTFTKKKKLSLLMMYIAAGR